MRVKLLKNTVINGGIWSVGAVLNLSPSAAKQLIREGRAIEVKAKKESSKNEVK